MRTAKIRIWIVVLSAAVTILPGLGQAQTKSSASKIDRSIYPSASSDPYQSGGSSPYPAAGTADYPAGTQSQSQGNATGSLGGQNPYPQTYPYDPQSQQGNGNPYPPQGSTTGSQTQYPPQDYPPQNYPPPNYPPQDYPPQNYPGQTAPPNAQTNYPGQAGSPIGPGVTSPLNDPSQQGYPSQQVNPSQQWTPPPPLPGAAIPGANAGIPPGCKVKVSTDQSTLHLMGMGGTEIRHLSLGSDRVKKVFDSPDGAWSVVVYKVRGTPQFGFIAFQLGTCEDQVPVDLPAAAATAAFTQSEIEFTLENGKSRRFPLSKPKFK
jgi:hypothetical protein